MIVCGDFVPCCNDAMRRGTRVAEEVIRDTGETCADEEGNEKSFHWVLRPLCLSY